MTLCTAVIDPVSIPVMDQLLSKHIETKIEGI